MEVSVSFHRRLINLSVMFAAAAAIAVAAPALASALPCGDACPPPPPPPPGVPTVTITGTMAGQSLSDGIDGQNPAFRFANLTTAAVTFTASGHSVPYPVRVTGTDSQECQNAAGQAWWFSTAHNSAYAVGGSTLIWQPNLTCPSGWALISFDESAQAEQNVRGVIYTTGTLHFVYYSLLPWI
jgi:hypothetical protein